MNGHYFASFVCFVYFSVCALVGQLAYGCYIKSTYEGEKHIKSKKIYKIKLNKMILLVVGGSCIWCPVSSPQVYQLTRHLSGVLNDVAYIVVVIKTNKILRNVA